MFFSIINVIFSRIVGSLAGYVAGRLMGTYPASTLHNIVLGMLGGFVGSFLLGLIGLRATGFVGDFVVSVVGACACIWIAHKAGGPQADQPQDRKSTRLNSSHVSISYAVFCLKKKKTKRS